MSARLNLDDISEVLQCAICLGTIRNPKQLVCNHEYCKNCLDNLLTFQADGTALIHCPKKCTKTTKIPRHGTTGELGASYMTKGMLEMIKAKDKDRSSTQPRPHCEASECRKDIEFYCVNCKKFKCKLCNCCDDTAPTGVKYDEDDKEIILFCRIHSTNIHWNCKTCVGAICCYCVHRKHQNHDCNTFEGVMHRFRAGNIEMIEKLDDNITRLNLEWKVAECSIAEAKELLDDNLRYRKVICLNEYIMFLNSEERRVKKEFSNVTLEQEKQHRVDDILPSYSQLLSTQIKFILKNRQVRQVCDIASRPGKKVSLSEHSFNAAHPLGDLEIDEHDDDHRDDTYNIFSDEFETIDEEMNLTECANLQQLLTQSLPRYQDNSVEALTKENEKLTSEIKKLKNNARENEKLNAHLLAQIEKFEDENNCIENEKYNFKRHLGEDEEDEEDDEEEEEEVDEAEEEEEEEAEEEEAERGVPEEEREEVPRDGEVEVEVSACKTRSRNSSRSRSRLYENQDSKRSLDEEEEEYVDEDKEDLLACKSGRKKIKFN